MGLLNSYWFSGEAPLTDSLISYYQYASGDVATDTMGNNPGTNNGVVNSSGGLVGPVGNYDGGDWIQINYANGSLFFPGAWSWTSWVTRDDSSNSQWIVSNRNASTNLRYQIVYSSAGNYVWGLFSSVGADKIQIRSNVTIPANGVRHHLAFTYDGSLTSEGMKLYIDGVEVSVLYEPNGNFVGIPQSGAVPLTLGTQSWNTGIGGWDGSMEQTAFWGKELSSTEVNFLISENQAGRSYI